MSVAIFANPVTFGQGTLTIVTKQHTLTTAMLAADQGVVNLSASPLVAPIFSSPAGLLLTQTGNQGGRVAIYNPSDSVNTVDLGFSVASTDGPAPFNLNPGNYVEFESYLGPLYGSSTGAAQNLYYATTAFT